MWKLRKETGDFMFLWSLGVGGVGSSANTLV